MPYRSDAQRRKFHALLEQGKISRSVVDEFDKASEGMNLPDRVTSHAPKKYRRPKTARSYISKIISHR